MSAEKSISQIHLSDGDAFLFAEFKSDFNLHLKIVNIADQRAFVGQASNLDLRSQAASIRLSFDDFVQKATHALFQSTTDRSNFIYTLDIKNETYVFRWKSIDFEETVINLGFVEMKTLDFEVLLTEILLSLADEMQGLRNSLQQINKELSTNKNQLSNALNKLSDANTLKESVEKELYSKFVLVLNEKKRKIKELEMHAKTNSGSSKISTISNKRKPTKVLAVSSSESEEVDGDLELRHPGPSNIAKRNSLPFEEETKSITQSKIRNRKAAVNKKNSYIPDSSAVSGPEKSYDKNEDSGSADSLMDFL